MVNASSWKEQLANHKYFCVSLVPWREMQGFERCQNISFRQEPRVALIMAESLTHQQLPLIKEVNIEATLLTKRYFGTMNMHTQAWQQSRLVFKSKALHVPAVCP